MPSVSLQQPQVAEAEAIAALMRQSKATAMPWLPVVHTLDEDVAWVAESLLVTDDVWTARSEGVLLGVLATRPGWVDQLYVLTERQGQGVGRRLLDHAKDRSGGALELWAFQRNHRARQFYEYAGFRVRELTDGAGNEEREPDLRYRWVSATGVPGGDLPGP